MAADLMARIRSIKPEFFTDPEVVACSPLARLLFIGSWNLADDFGVLKDEPKRLRLELLPGDDVDAADLVNELVDRGLLLRRQATDGTRVLVIRTFCVHQKLDKRAAGRYGHPDEFTPPPTEPQPIPPTPADSLPLPPNPNHTTGQDRNGTDRTSNIPVEPEPSKALALVPPTPSPTATELVFAAWQEATGKRRAVLDDKRRRIIQRELKRFPPADLCDAVRGWRQFPHNRGENERGTEYNSLELCLRDAEHIERFRDAERDPQAASRGRFRGLTEFEEAHR